MGHISIRDLQKISGETIGELDGPTAVKSGDRTIALLIPLKPPNIENLKKALKKAERLARERDPAEDTAFLEAEGIDPTHWTPEAIKALRAKGKSRRK